MVDLPQPVPHEGHELPGFSVKVMSYDDPGSVIDVAEVQVRDAQLAPQLARVALLSSVSGMVVRMGFTRS